MEDVNNVHLVCRNLHQIANLHVNPKLCFHKDSSKGLESLIKSSRIFEELEFSYGSDEYLLSQEKSQILEKYLGFTGPHTKTLKICNLKVDSMILQKLLNLLPNLKALELNSIKILTTNEEPIKWDLKSTKIECLKMGDCHGFESLLDSL